MDQTSRFTSSDPRDLGAEQRALYDLFTSGPRADPSSPFSLVDGSGRLQGPPATWVLSPPLGRALEKLGGAVRFE
ncbi:MAG: carboxymuconolactone decarboxylase family protein, partial [Trebonia sp.]